MNRQIYIILSFLVVNLNCRAQEFVSSDGFDLGPKSDFLEVCTENMTFKISEENSLINVERFCICMADVLIPSFTKAKIDYYFREDHMDEMITDTANIRILRSCIMNNLKEAEERNEILEKALSNENVLLVDSIIQLSNLQENFEGIRDQRILFKASDNEWNEDEIENLKNRINFDRVKLKYYSAFVDFDKEELIEIIERLKDERAVYPIDGKTTSSILEEDFASFIDILIFLSANELELKWK